eukprot:9817246-Lingulodinium_polyedra.AAC.1
MPGPIWQTATRFRTGMPKAAGPDPDRNQGNCRNTIASGRVCNEPLTASNTHPVHCACGGEVVLRHD